MRLTVYFPEDSPTTHEFVGDTLTVGRLGDNEVQIEEGSVSSRHAEIIVQDGSAVLRDLGSTNGTFLDGQKVSTPLAVAMNTQVRVGQTTFELRA